ncbi:FkbM family methyltransferase [Candidatus Synechococcus calcipolaris G9]|uniref:FkbM family methyltransferase n=1 Tax=Candidatus Synechococcus calcipolaris G9 TaxID=1497997 RepID=A0ABT6EWB7_9SYNE|nr:FkbM family methyltransferase [Candidatus Synechococcus calcipolaris]MDG2990077.1 FkbM family methyltransferase [Candidatus Synechococcus calcipolaris G9]
MTRLLESDRDLDIYLFGSRIHINSIQEHGYLRMSRLCTSSQFLRDEVQIVFYLAALLPHADAFLDLGANVGIFSALLVRLRSLYPDLKFYAFEPHPETYQRLVKTLGDTPVETHCVALSNQAGELTFIGGAVSNIFTSEAYRSAFHGATAETMTLPARRLDSFAIDGDRLLLKVDVEGQELEVLEGAEAFFKEDRVYGIYLDGYRNPGVTTFLQGYGFEIEAIRDSAQGTGHAGGFSGYLAMKPKSHKT